MACRKTNGIEVAAFVYLKLKQANLELNQWKCSKHYTLKRWFSLQVLAFGPEHLTFSKRPFLHSEYMCCCSSLQTAGLFQRTRSQVDTDPPIQGQTGRVAELCNSSHHIPEIQYNHIKMVFTKTYCFYLSSTVRVPAHERFWHEKVHPSENGNSAFLPRRAVIG